jgi:hypothetical protein
MPQPWKLITALALAALACLVAMVTVTLASGVSQETFEVVRDPDSYAAQLVAHAGALRLVFAIDAVFLVIYATLFVVFGRQIETGATRSLVTLALAALLGTAVLDMVEDHHILAMLYAAEVGATPSIGELSFQHTLSQVKFNLSYLGLFALGLAVPRATLAGRALALLLTVGTLAQGAWLYAAPVALLAVGSFGRWVGFVVGFALVIALARRPAAGAAATGAPA